MMRRAILVSWTAGLCLVPVSLGAHPTAASDVVLTLGADGTVDVALRTNLQALVIKLEALAGRPASAPAASGDLRESVVGLASTLRGHVTLTVDGRTVPLALTDVRRDGDTVVVLLHGRAPGDAARVSWRTRLVFGAYPFVIRRAGSPDEVFEWLQGPQWSTIPPPDHAAAAGGWRAGISAVGLGFVHVLPRGLDHILFVLGLFLLAARVRPVLLQVSVFTLAHSATLALAMAGVIALPAAVVEPLIALSLVCVAIENLLTSELRPRRLALVFGFGLLHGMGFAGALADLRLPAAAFLPTLVGFNVGVEIGQLAVVALAALTFAAASVRPEANARRLMAKLASVGIGLTGLCWTVERLI
jgi:hypothetical protein